MNQAQEANQFKKSLQEYWATQGITQIKIPQIGGKELNLFKLYKSVCKKGGGQAVSHNKLWKQIVDEFGLPSTCTSASFTLKNHYQKYLLGYELGKKDNSNLPQLVAGRTRKAMMGGRGMGQNMMSINYRYGDRPDNSNLTTQLTSQYEKVDENKVINFIKRTKMYPSMPQVKRMILGFQSRVKEQANFSLNTLMLYSVNTQAPFLFMQYPHVIQSIYGFVKWLFPPNNIDSLQSLRTVLLALRNLAIDYRNLQQIQQSGLSDLLKQIFDAKIDKQISRNIVDIFSSLTNIGFDCSKIVNQISIYLQKQNIDDLETGIDLLKTLVEQKQQICQDIIIGKLDFFTRLLVHQQLFIRETILQIFGYITDKSHIARQSCLANFKFMSRIFAMMSYSQGMSEKQAQLAGYILSNLSKDDENLQLLRKFEKKIAIISFNDDSLSSIATSLLFKLTRPEQYKMQLAEQQNQ